MIYDFIQPHKNNAAPLYLQIYQSIKENIENGNIAEEVKLPSIRKLAEDLSLSRTTIENAYAQLCAEGYILNVPQKGYYVQSAQYLMKNSLAENMGASAPVSKSKIFKYDFSGKSVDIGTINLKLWKKYMRNILNCEDLITSYGHPQGEPQLRSALSHYSYSVRGVCARENEIVIGAGTQPLLYLICGLIKHYGTTVAMEGTGFSHAKQVFADCGLKTVNIESDRSGIQLKSLKESGARILLVNPSGNLSTGKTIKMDRRLELIAWAKKTNSIIIEDDYNGELRYSTHPIPAMQGYCKDHVIYMGSFSKLLLPSVRLSYMTLPKNLLMQYAQKISKYNQTASKIEQLALGEYIVNGQLERHLRKLRKLYSEKSTHLQNCLKSAFKQEASVFLKETSLAVSVYLKQSINIIELEKELAKQGIKIIVSGGQENQFDLSFSGIPSALIKEAVVKIKNTVDLINRV